MRENGVRIDDPVVSGRGRIYSWKGLNLLALTLSVVDGAAHGCRRRCDHGTSAVARRGGKSGRYEDAAGKPVPPDVRAAMYWLENRRPDRWKRRRETPPPEPEIEFSDEEKEV